MEQKYLKIGRAAAMIDVSPWTIRGWIKDQKIRVHRFGGAIRIRESDLLAFAEVRPGKSKSYKNE